MSDETKTDPAENRAALGVPASIDLGGQVWLLSPLTPADHGRIWDHCRNLACANVRSPLSAINEVFKDLAPEVAAMAMREAVAQSGGSKKPEPTREAVAAQSVTVDGLRFAFWLSARKLHPDLTQARAAELVGEDERYELMEKLLGANGKRAGDDPKASGPAG